MPRRKQERPQGLQEHQNTSQDQNARPGPALSLGYLTRFSLPLALTFLMMSGAAPLVSNGITWAHGSEGESLHLSAFLTAFAISVFLYSPVFTSRNVANRTIIDRPSLLAFARFYLFWGAIGSSLILLVATHQPSADFLLGRLLNTSPQAVELARGGMLVFSPLPILITLRGMAQGCHITNGETWFVGVGTALRFSTMAAFIFGYAIHHTLSGPQLGGYTYLFGITAETVFVLATLKSKPQWILRTSRHTPLSFADFFTLAGPLMLAAVIQQFLSPILIYLINSSNAPTENAATFNLVRDTVWILVSILMTIQSSVISFATSRTNLIIILRFSAVMLLSTTLTAAALALTPLREWIFINWLQVDNQQILTITFRCLRWLIIIPTATLIFNFMISLHTRSGKTGWVTLGNVSGMMLILFIPRVVDIQSVDGAVLAIIANAVFMLFSTSIQALGLLNGGFKAVLTPLDSQWGPKTSRITNINPTRPPTQHQPT